MPLPNFTNERTYFERVQNYLNNYDSYENEQNAQNVMRLANIEQHVFVYGIAMAVLNQPTLDLKNEEHQKHLILGLEALTKPVNEWSVDTNTQIDDRKIISKMLCTARGAQNRILDMGINLHSNISTVIDVSAFAVRFVHLNKVASWAIYGGLKTGGYLNNRCKRNLESQKNNGMAQGEVDKLIEGIPFNPEFFNDLNQHNLSPEARKSLVDQILNDPEIFTAEKCSNSSSVNLADSIKTNSPCLFDLLSEDEVAGIFTGNFTEADMVSVMTDPSSNSLVVNHISQQYADLATVDAPLSEREQLREEIITEVDECYGIISKEKESAEQQLNHTLVKAVLAEGVELAAKIVQSYKQERAQEKAFNTERDALVKQYQKLQEQYRFKLNLDELKELSKDSHTVYESSQHAQNLFLERASGRITEVEKAKLYEKYKEEFKKCSALAEKYQKEADKNKDKVHFWRKQMGQFARSIANVKVNTEDRMARLIGKGAMQVGLSYVPVVGSALGAIVPDMIFRDKATPRAQKKVSRYQTKLQNASQTADIYQELRQESLYNYKFYQELNAKKRLSLLEYGVEVLLPEHYRTLLQKEIDRDNGVIKTLSDENTANEVRIQKLKEPLSDEYWEKLKKSKKTKDILLYNSLCEHGYGDKKKRTEHNKKERKENQPEIDVFKDQNLRRSDQIKEWEEKKTELEKLLLKEQHFAPLDDYVSKQVGKMQSANTDFVEPEGFNKLSEKKQLKLKAQFDATVEAFKDQQKAYDKLEEGHHQILAERQKERRAISTTLQSLSELSGVLSQLHFERSDPSIRIGKIADSSVKSGIVYLTHIKGEVVYYAVYNGRQVIRAEIKADEFNEDHFPAFKKALASGSANDLSPQNKEALFYLTKKRGHTHYSDRLLQRVVHKTEQLSLFIGVGGGTAYEIYTRFQDIHSSLSLFYKAEKKEFLDGNGAFYNEYMKTLLKKTQGLFGINQSSMEAFSNKHLALVGLVCVWQPYVLNVIASLKLAVFIKNCIYPPQDPVLNAMNSQFKDLYYYLGQHFKNIDKQFNLISEQLNAIHARLGETHNQLKSLTFKVTQLPGKGDSLNKTLVASRELNSFLERVDVVVAQLHDLRYRTFILGDQGSKRQYTSPNQVNVFLTDIVNQITQSVPLNGRRASFGIEQAPDCLFSHSHDFTGFFEKQLKQQSSELPNARLYLFATHKLIAFMQTLFKRTIENSNGDFKQEPVEQTMLLPAIPEVHQQGGKFFAFLTSLITFMQTLFTGTRENSNVNFKQELVEQTMLLPAIQEVHQQGSKLFAFLTSLTENNDWMQHLVSQYLETLKNIRSELEKLTNDRADASKIRHVVLTNRIMQEQLAYYKRVNAERDAEIRENLPGLNSFYPSYNNTKKPGKDNLFVQYIYEEPPERRLTAFYNDSYRTMRYQGKTLSGSVQITVSSLKN